MKTETGWLIELEDSKHPGCVTGLCLGVVQIGKLGTKMPNWTSPDLAIRFARKEDAEQAALFFCPSGGIVATEHSWE